MNMISIGQAWVESAAFLRAERRLLVPVALAALVLPAVVLSMVMPTGPGGAPLTMADRPEPGAWMFVGLLALCVMLVGQLAISRLALGWTGRLADALRHGVKRFLPLFVANILLVLGLLFPFIMILTAVQLAAPASTNVAMLVLMIPILIIVIRASLSLPVAAGEALGPIATLQRAFSISRGATLRLLGFAMLFFVAAIIVGGAVSSVVGTVVIAALGQPEAWTVSAMLIALVGGVLQAIIITLWTVMLTRLYTQMADRPAAV